jgi:hypothetical protein
MLSHWITKRFLLTLVLFLLSLVGCHRAPQRIDDILSSDVWPIAVADGAKFEGDTLVLTKLRSLNGGISKQASISDYRGKIIFGIRRGEKRAFVLSVDLAMTLATPIIDIEKHPEFAVTPDYNPRRLPWSMDASDYDLVVIASDGQASFLATQNTKYILANQQADANEAK